MDFWKILGIEPTKNREEIVEAYRIKLEENNPEENQEGFMALRQAYDEAMDYCNKDDDVMNALIEKASRIYDNFSKRNSVDRWKEYLSEDLFQSVDTRADAEDKLIVFLMQKYRLSQEVLTCISKEFDWANRRSELNQHYPEGFFNYVFEVINDGEYYKMEYFDGDDYADYDKFIELCMDFSSLLSNMNEESIGSVVSELDALEIYHPFCEELKAILAFRKGNFTLADEITKDFPTLYPNETRLIVLRIDVLLKQEKFDEAKKTAEILKKVDPGNRNIPIVEIAILSLSDVEKAKERYYEFNRAFGYGDDAGDLAKLINKRYTPFLENKIDSLTEMERVNLAWCYYEGDDLDKAYNTLDSFEPKEEKASLKYYKLKGFLASQTERNKEAIEFITKWESLRETVEDEKSEEAFEVDEERRIKNQIDEIVAMYRAKSFAYLQNGEPENAELYLKKVTEKDPANMDAYIALNNMYMDDGKFEEIINLNTSIMQEHGDYPPIVYMTALAEYRSERYSDALKYFDIAEEYMPYLGRIYHYKLMIFDAWYMTNHFEDTLSRLKNLPDNPLSQKLMELYEIKLDRMKGNLEEASKKIKELLPIVDEEDDQIGSDDRALMYQEAGILEKENQNYPKALEYIERASKISPLNRSIELDKGYYMILNGELDRAEKFYEDLIKVYPQDAIYPMRLSATKRRLGKYDEAIEGYKKSLELDPERTEIYTFMSDVYIEKGDYDEALKCQTIAIEKDPSFENYYDRATHYSNMGKNEEAYKDLLSAREISPYDSDVLTYLGIIAMKLGLSDEAQNHYEKAMEHFDSSNYRFNTHAYFVVKYIREKKYNEALGILEKAFEVFGEEGGSWAMIRKADCHYYLGNIENAKKSYLRAIELDPYNPEAHCDYAIFLYQTQGKDAAINYWNGIGKSLEKISTIQMNMGLFNYMYLMDFEKAVKHYEKAVKLDKELDMPGQLSVINLYECLWYSLRTKGNKLDKNLKPVKLFSTMKKERIMKYFAHITSLVEKFYEANGFYENELSQHWLSLIAESYFYKGELEKAEKFAIMCMNTPMEDFALVNKSFDALYILGMVYEARGELEKAYEKYFELTEENKGTKYDFSLMKDALERVKSKMNMRN